MKYLTDKEDRIVFLRGVNVNSSGKGDPERLGINTRKDFLRLSRDWGFNAVRFLLFWDALEPVKGQYSETYLSLVRERLDWCEEAGLKVILDMHQDLYSSKFGGDGAPEWAVFDEGQSFTYEDPWEKNYIHRAVKTGIDHFWIGKKGHPELQEHFMGAVLHCLSRLAGHSAVLGMDLYNEPTMATLHGIFNFERRYLSRFLQKLINRIREHHSDLWLFFEPTALGPNQGFRTNLKKLNDPRNGESRLVYFPHIYTLDLDIRGRYAGWPVHIWLWERKRKSEARKFDVPLMAGEFGLDESKPGSIRYLREATAMFDRICSGWFYWAFDEKGGWGMVDSLNREQKKCDVLIRPYPRCVAGEDPRFSWNHDEKIFSCRYRSRGYSGNSEFYLPSRCWPGGFTFESGTEGLIWDFNNQSRILTVRSSKRDTVAFTVLEKKRK